MTSCIAEFLGKDIVLRITPISGLMVFGILAIYGLRLLYKGVRNDVYDWVGETRAPRWSYIAFGVLCQVQLIGFIVFLWRQGYFGE